MGIVSWLIVGAIAGWLAGLLVRGDEGLGVIGHIVLGIVGAIVGGFIAGLVTGGNDYITGVNATTIIVATIGAVIAVVAFNALTGRTRTGRGPI
jgi:uncharacterized membrane protein YeaQ/YmgE (transglycosylase-associated protein family)